VRRAFGIPSSPDDELERELRERFERLFGSPPLALKFQHDDAVELFGTKENSYFRGSRLLIAC
jgi:hypothetical protein